ncbi:hypothetical protein GF312_03815 [Candidatus Poribacteria bacterium]|nr:hypothetical protein [Candidatus Poribacteria bacterium]
MKFLVILICLTLIFPAEKAFCIWPDDPELNLPICMAAGTQEHPRITTDGASGAIIVWQDIASVSSDIYAQRVDARGEIRWTIDGVAVCLEKKNQWFPNLVSDGSGGAIIAWWDERNANPNLNSDTDIYAQRINGEGQVQWEPGGVPVCTLPRAQLEFNIAADGEGGALIVWHDYRDETWTPYIYAQRVNKYGEMLWEKDGILVASKDNSQQYPDIASDGYGGAIIVWQDWRDGKGDVYAQRISAEGEKIWKYDGIPLCQMPERQWHPYIINDGFGGAIVAWMDHRNSIKNEFISRADNSSDSGWDIYTQRINAQGKSLWQENGIPLCLMGGDQYDYTMISDGEGGAFVTWLDQRKGDWDIYGQRLNSSGKYEWKENGIPVCDEPDNQFNPNIVSDGVDGSIISWWDRRILDGDIYAQRIDKSGNFLWVESGAAICLAKGTQQDPHPINSGIGSAIIVWWDKREIDANIYAQRVISE